MSKNDAIKEKSKKKIVKNKASVSTKEDKKFRKKIEVIIVILMVITTVVLLVYFGNKKTLYKCSRIIDQSASGYKIKTYYEIYAYKNDTNYIEIKEIVYSDENSILDFYKSDLTKMYEEQNKKYGGYSIKSEKDRGKMIVTAKIDISKLKLKEFAEDNGISDYIKNNKLTPDGAKKMFDNLGASCEK